MPIDHHNALPPGTRFEEYRLDAVLGSGGFGITYRAYDANLDKFVAIKEYLPGEFATRAERYTVVPQSSTDAQDYHWGLNRFLDEARTLARFKHPHLNQVYRFFESNGTAYMVLEYVEGETLADKLTRERQLPEDSLTRLLEEVLSGLAEMHEAGYVHRDIKPGNLMLREEDGSAVVLDFGAARQAVGRRSQRLTTILTPGYAPIEQYDSQADDVGPWSDIYALGMVAYRCISGVGDGDLPDAVTRGRTQRKGDIDLEPTTEAGKGQYSQKLLEAIDWAIQMDEGDRPQTVTEWQATLAGRKTKKRIAKSAHKHTTKTTKATTQRTRRNWSGVALALVVGVLIAAGAWWAWQQYPELFGQGLGDTPPVAQQAAEAATSGETLQETETGKAGEIVADVEETPKPDQTTVSTESTEPEVKPLATEPAKAAPAEEDEVTRLLAAAEADLKARRLTSPAGHNAWERYQEVLKLDSSNLEALGGMERVIESYMELFRVALEQEDFDKADSYLTRIRELHPDSPRLEEGGERLEAAKVARAERLAGIERQRQEEEAARLAELERQRVAQAIEAHWEAFEVAIQAEDRDEATGILAQVRELNPEDQGLAAGEKRLEAAHTAAQRQRAQTIKKHWVTFETALDEDNFVDANNSLMLIRQLDPEVSELTEATQRMSTRQDALAIERRYAGEMVIIAGGTFRMGDLSGDGRDTERPVHSVTVPDFKLGKYEVTFDQWDACVADGGCGGYTPDSFVYGRSGQPVVEVSWDDVHEFIDWLNVKIGGNFRLPTEAEWEYAARAGSATKYSWGNRVGSNRANCDGCGGFWDDRWSAPVGSFPANAWGLHDMHGNMFEWVQDCWNDSYEGAPTDGSAWISGNCDRRVVRGGDWGSGPRDIRSATRYKSSRKSRFFAGSISFRLAQDK